MTRARSFGYAILAVALAGAPRTAQACAVCTAGRDEEQRSAFLLTTIFLSVMPLLFVGAVVGIVWWLRRRARSLVEPEASEEAAAPAPAEI